MVAKVCDVMTRDVKTVDLTAKLEEAARKMRDCNVGALPVYSGNVLVGIVTDRDITVKATAAGLDPVLAEVEEVMTWKAEWCFEDMDVESAVRIMEAKKVHRLAVFNYAGDLVGVLSLSDIATRTHDSRLVERVVEATAASPALSRKGDVWEPFGEGVAD